MAKGFKHGAGGGAALNFKVVGNPQPAAPAENTIWVDTDVPITAWEFSSKTPAEPVEGMVWFQSGAASVAQFNALKKNNLTIYPNGSSQYVDGAWVGVDSRTYQNGEWVGWILYLYSFGEVNDIAGCITQRGHTKYAGAGSVLINEGTEAVSIKTDNGSCALVYFINKVDLTPYKTLVYHGAVWNHKGGKGCGIGVWDDSWQPVAILDGMSRADGLHTIDISAITGSYYIGICIAGLHQYIEAYMREMYLE